MKSSTKSAYDALPKKEKRKRLAETAIVFLKLGATAFGGPIAHIAMMEDEIIRKRSWITREKFLDLYAATNLLPGPNSTELAIHLGYQRGGILGLIIAGGCFILPAMTIVTLLAMVYTAYGTLPQVAGIMYGISPVVIAIVLNALVRFAKTTVKSVMPGILALLVAALSLLGVHELILLGVSGVLMMLYHNRSKIKPSALAVAVPLLPLFTGTAVNNIAERSLSLSAVFLTFLKIGAVLYGSGYVLLVFLEADFVERFAVLSNQQLLDAVSIGQFTPGPVFTTATFIGYVLHGFPGAVLATIGIFLPSFVLVGLLQPVIPRLRNSSWVSGLLDGIVAASLGLMAVVTIKLALSAVTDIPTGALAAVALFLVFKFKLNSAWLILGGGLAGYLITLL